MHAEDRNRELWVLLQQFPRLLPAATLLVLQTTETDTAFHARSTFSLQNDVRHVLRGIVWFNP